MGGFEEWWETEVITCPDFGFSTQAKCAAYDAWDACAAMEASKWAEFAHKVQNDLAAKDARIAELEAEVASLTREAKKERTT